ncbi:hypothetical protein K474DRAFT_1705699 [Panus rudis PR-1116 ss-1]|nr:hypothetical protein K474DRAFT_1705699 [Panus rudis PR-1116 ss-1]
MARGESAAPTQINLPKVVFTRIDDDYGKLPAGVQHDYQMRAYGFNDGSDFDRPDHYIRYIEPLESDLAVQVEYDMDEQDQEWLDAINAERKKENLDTVKPEVFEIVMDRLEKEWFDLTKNIPKPDFAMPSEDSTCAICDDSEGENTNAIVFCDGCNLAVHQDCYGVPYIPEGQWLCRKCTVSPENPVSCVLCPSEGGAFKQTVNGEWVHLLCAIWVPETAVANDVFMEPVTGIDKIPKQRWRLRCSVCDVRHGACIQCNKASCAVAFHATCARKEKLLMPMKSSQGSEAPTLAAFCEKHLPKEQADARAAALAAEHTAVESDGGSSTHTLLARGSSPSSPKSSKTARAYAKTYKPGPPLVPNIIVRRLLQYITRINIRQKEKFIVMVCKYWSLKREARRGAPLLKRLHLEPWTASAGGLRQSDEDKAKKLKLMKRLRTELESIRMLADLCRERETWKSEQAETVQDLMANIFYPHEKAFRNVFEKIRSIDKNDCFKNPVSRVDVPDYYDIIKQPMCWVWIDKKLDGHEYWDFKQFKADLELIYNNAMTYNKPGTPFYKAAQSVKNKCEQLLPYLHQFILAHPEVQVPQPTDDNTPLSLFPPEPPLGELEPPLELLDLLAEDGAIKDEIDLILSCPPLESLFSYEFPVFKPPPPPPPRKKSKREKQREKQRERAAERALTREARANVAASSSAVPGETIAEAEGSGAGKKSRKVSGGQGHGHHGQNEEPPIVDHVDKQDFFKLFENGWILPPEQKRGGRAPVERKPLPPPRKKARAGGTSSSVGNRTTATVSPKFEEAPLPTNDDTDVSMQYAEPTANVQKQEAAQQDLLAVPPSQDESMPMDVDVPPLVPMQSPRVEPMSIAEGPALPTGDSLPTEPSITGSIVKDAPLAEPSGEQHEHIDAHAGPTDEGPDASVELPSAAEEAPKPAEERLGAQPRAEITSPTRSRRNKQKEPSIIIEEVETPATRKEKNKRRKEERRLAQEAAEAAARAQTQVQANTTSTSANVNQPADHPVAGPSTEVAAEAEWDKVSELSSLSEIDDDEDDEKDEFSTPAPVTPTRPNVATGKKKATRTAAPAVDELGVIKPGEVLEDRTLVWAKADSFPWWPAKVIDPRDEEVPEVQLQLWREKSTKKNPWHIVQFFDKEQTWQVFPAEKLLRFGDFPSLDEDMIASKSKRQKWKNPSMRTKCRDAYREAYNSIEPPDAN